MAQKQHGRQKQPEKQANAPSPKANPKIVATGKKLKEEMDKVMDEIDGVLEKDAEGFVKGYIQKGGE